MKKILTCAALSVVLLSGCSFNKADNGVIKVNGTVITQAEFDKALNKTIDGSPFASFGGAKNFVKTEENVMYLIYKEKVAKELIVKTLLNQEIEKRNIKVSDEDLQKEKESIIDKVGSKEELAKLLKARGISNSEFVEDLKTQVKIKKLVDSVQKVKISDADTLKYYNTHPDQFKQQEQVRASHILISANTLELIKQYKAKDPNITSEKLNAKVEETIAQQKAKAEDILKQVKANPDKFEDIAKAKSDDKTSAERGGELGFFSRDVMVPEFSNAAFSMKPDTVSENLVESPYGFHIIKVTDRIAAGKTPYAKVKEEIKFYLETQKQIEILKGLTDSLRKNAKIEYVDTSFDPANMEKAAIENQKKVTEKVKEMEGKKE